LSELLPVISWSRSLREPADCPPLFFAPELDHSGHLLFHVNRLVEVGRIEKTETPCQHVLSEKGAGVM